MAGQLHEAHELLLIPHHITEMDQRVIAPDHLAAVVEDEVRESCRTAAALEYILMAKIRIRNQIKHCLFLPFTTKANSHHRYHPRLSGAPSPSTGTPRKAGHEKGRSA